MTMTENTFTNFNVLKIIPTSGYSGAFTNPENGVLDRGYILHLHDFNGDMVITGNTIKDFTARVSS